MTEPVPDPAPASGTTATAVRNAFAIPSPLRRLFTRFPLHTTPENSLPARCAAAAPGADGTPILYLFTDEEGAARGSPSFNPPCLKWQTYLKITGTPFRTAPSTNHASPTGSLPFLQTPTTALPSSKLESHIHASQSTDPPLAPPQTYLALLDSALRPAYLHALYLTPANTPLLTSLYVPDHTYPVRAALLSSLRGTAEGEVLSVTRSPFVNAEAIYAAAEEALSALADLLGEGEWFLGEPTLFDASVFAYTNFLLDERFVWGDGRLRGLVKGFPKLVEHRERILGRYWGDGEKR